MPDQIHRNSSHKRQILAELQRLQEALCIMQDVDNLPQIKRMMTTCILQTTFFLPSINHTSIDFDTDTPGRK